MSLISVKNVSHDYAMGDRQFRALTDIDFTINEGDFVAILGPSGSGKSTLLHILGCLLRPSQGSVSIGGHDISKLSDTELSLLRNQEIGFIFQQFHLLPSATILENIMLPSKYPVELTGDKAAVEKRARDIARELEIDDLLDKMPNQLSGGQQQRVAIARALINEARVILADEPTGNLDSKTAKTVMGIFERLNRQGKTIILITHDANVAAQCPHSIEILDGKIGQRNMPAEVTESAVKPLQNIAYNSDTYLRLFAQLLPLAWMNIRRTWGRSLSTMLGITIGIAAVLSMLTFGTFTKDTILASYQTMGVNKISLWGNPNWRLRASDTVKIHFDGFDWDKDIEPLRKIFPQIRLITPQLRQWLRSPVVHAGKSMEDDLRVLGVNEQFFAINNKKLREGRLISPFHVENKSRVCVIGSAIADRLFEKSSPIGKVIQLGAEEDSTGYTCSVIGVLDSQKTNSSWEKPDKQIIMPYTYYLAVQDGGWSSRLRNITLQLRQGSDIERISKSVKKWFEQKYGIAGDFSTGSDAIMIAHIKKFLSMFTLLITTIALITLTVGGIGIMNLMLVSLNERYREIGLRKAIGATDFSVRYQMLLESVLLCTVAGVVGMAIGFAAYQGIIYGAAKFIDRLTFDWVVNPWAFAFSFFAIVASGVLSGLIPALRAEKLQIIEALRHE